MEQPPPIKLKIEETETGKNNYLTKTKIPLREAIKKANEIISQEANIGDYDTEQANKESKGEYTIRKIKNYPDKIYTIDYWDGKYLFNIGIKGEK